MALMNLKPLMKQKTLGPGRSATPAIGASTFANKPMAGLPAVPSVSGGLLKAKKPWTPGNGGDLMKRLTGK